MGISLLYRREGEASETVTNVSKASTVICAETNTHCFLKELGGCRGCVKRVGSETRKVSDLQVPRGSKVKLTTPSKKRTFI